MLEALISPAPAVTHVSDGRSRSSALLTDHYELTMVEAALHSGVAHNQAVFEVFARSLPAGRRFAMVAGTGRLLEEIEAFRFAPDQLEWLVATGVISSPTATFLADWAFRGRIDAFAEGDVFFANSPILTVQADFVSAVLLETLVLSVLNHDCAVASAAARFRTAAPQARLIEGGSRRTHESAAVAAARAAWIAGFDVSSNLQAGMTFGVPTGGTAAHAFTLAHTDELSAFAAQAAALGDGTVFLVDTFDVAEGVTRAVEATNGRLGGVRIDSGDLAANACIARSVLDAAGATESTITVSGDLDEFAIEKLVAKNAPIDAFLAGTKLVCGSGHPTANLVYKLVAIADIPDGPLIPVAKRSAGKATIGGRKTPWRFFDANGCAVGEVAVAAGASFVPADLSVGRGSNTTALPLHHRLWDTVRVDHSTAASARVRAIAAIASLEPTALDLEVGLPALAVTVLEPTPGGGR